MGLICISIEELIALFDHMDRKAIREMIFFIKGTVYVFRERKAFPILTVHDLVQHTSIIAFQF